MIKLAIISSFLGAIKNRYVSYQEDRPLAERIGMASRVKGIGGLEVCYPQDFANPAELKALLGQHKLGVSAINFRSRRTGQWMRGSFTSELANERRDVVDDLKRCMDIAAEMGVNRITTCPLNEGHDYIFEMDYGRAYDYMEETVGEAAAHRQDVKLCIEYKMNDPRARCLLGNAGETLAFCERLGMPNVGVTLDFGHSIQAGERPAQSVVLLSRAKRLFYVHINDNDKFWDWDMIPGAYNFWDFIEFFYYLDKEGYDDWFGLDIFPKEIDTVETYEVVADAANKLLEMARKLEPVEIAKLTAQRNPSASVKYMFSKLSDD